MPVDRPEYVKRVSVHRFRVHRSGLPFLGGCDICSPRSILYSHAFSIPACLASLASGQAEFTNQRFRFSVNP
jgi:hypothetical protein